MSWMDTGLRPSLSMSLQTDAAKREAAGWLFVCLTTTKERIQNMEHIDHPFIRGRNGPVRFLVDLEDGISSSRLCKDPRVEISFRNRPGFDLELMARWVPATAHGAEGPDLPGND
ncbi:hypothetical protein F4810DRAFT_709757 [Camillea tinctor]|nr:hypothetical protein F4810DRAFT_709757 [Camillea tinctor]